MVVVVVVTDVDAVVDVADVVVADDNDDDGRNVDDVVVDVGICLRGVGVLLMRVCDFANGVTSNRRQYARNIVNT